MALIGLALFRGDYWPVWVSLGVAFGVVNWVVWRDDGPAHRWRARLLKRYPPRT